MVYPPAGSSGRMYSPAELETVVRGWFVCKLMALTCAPATIAPELSNTVPCMVPVAWAFATRLKHTAPRSRKKNLALVNIDYLQTKSDYVLCGRDAIVADLH